MSELVPTGIVTVCCECHRDNCCDPEDCGPCCEDCPTCPTLNPHLRDRCRPVDVDGETMRVHGAGEWTETHREHFAVLVRAVKQRAAEICTCGHLKGEHRIDLKTPVCAAWNPNPHGGDCGCREYTPTEET